MSKLTYWLTAYLAMAVYAPVYGAEALAFVTEIKGEAHIARGDGKEEAADIGDQLYVGDSLKADKGNAVLIYLSGRSVDVTAGQTHAVQGEQAESSKLLGRVMNTLVEIAGPLDENKRPVVHGMARNLTGVTGALPANTRISKMDFLFSWDAREAVTAYDFTLETAEGEVLATKTVQGTQLSAADLGLEPGKRYMWEVVETESFVPHGSGKSWVEIATKEHTAQLNETFSLIEKNYSGDTATLFKATNYFREGFLFETERSIIALKEKRPLSSIENKLLMLSYIKMERWDRLSAPKEKKEEPVRTEE